MPPLTSRRDLSFLLYEVLNVEELTARERYAEHSRETFDSTLSLAGTLAERYFAPHNRKADLHEPEVVDGRVQLIPEVKEALEHFRQAGFFSAHHDYDQGGMQLPWVVTQAAHAQFQAANVSTAGYPFLTIANANLLQEFASEEQKQKYLQPLIEGRFFGTMALTEPQAGSGLSDISTKAEPLDDGTYCISGTKIFISAGEHELSENIIHLVLARIKGAPQGTKGISLFIVPRYRVGDDGTLGEANDVTLAGLIHKMGYRGTTSTVLNFGEGGACIGELVGKPHEGLKYMFSMMNEARIGVGLGATMLGYAGYLYSLEYARSRPQGRRVSSKDPTAPPVNIIEHSDVRRMLLVQKAYVEGALGLCLYAAQLVDEQKTHPDERVRNEAGLLLDVLTPIVKAWPSRYALEANYYAMQILGGYGYTREYPLEQLYRDNRLNPIHEGTNGIQALDLLGRKVTMQGGAGLKLLARAVARDLEAAAEYKEVSTIRDGVKAALDLAVCTTTDLLTKAGELGAERLLANADSYLELLGHTVLGWVWLRQATVAAAALAGASSSDKPFYRGKLQAAQYYARFELPKTRLHAEVLTGFDETVLEMQEDWF